MLYEVIGIVRPGNLSEIKEIVTLAGSIVLNNKGVIRGIANWGVFALPRPASLNQVRYDKGHYFAMRFDANAVTQESVNKKLREDPRVIRNTSVKLGDGKLETLVKFGGPDWLKTY